MARERQVQILSTWILLESLSNTLQKTFVWRQSSLLAFLIYCCLKVDRGYDPHSKLHATKGLTCISKYDGGPLYYFVTNVSNVTSNFCAVTLIVLPKDNLVLASCITYLVLIMFAFCLAYIVLMFLVKLNIIFIVKKQV